MNSYLYWHRFSFTLTMRILDAKKSHHRRKITVATCYSQSSSYLSLTGVTLHNAARSDWPCNKLLRIRSVPCCTLPNHCHQSRLPTFPPRTTRCCQSLIVLNQARFPQGEITSCRDNAPPTHPTSLPSCSLLPNVICNYHSLGKLAQIRSCFLIKVTFQQWRGYTCGCANMLISHANVLNDKWPVALHQHLASPREIFTSTWGSGTQRRVGGHYMNVNDWLFTSTLIASRHELQAQGWKDTVGTDHMPVCTLTHHIQIYRVLIQIVTTRLAYK